MTVAEGQFQALRSGRFSLRARGADGLIIEFNDPLVRRISERAYGFLTSDGFEVVIDDLIRGGQFLGWVLRERRLNRAAYEQQEAESQKELGGTKHTNYFFVPPLTL